MDEYEGRIDLLYYVRVIAKRKWLIIAATLLCALAGGIYGFLAPAQWKVDAVIQGGKFFNFEQHEEVIIITGEQLAGQINEGYYHNALASELKMRPEELPRLKAKNLRWTEMVEVTLKTSDVDMAKRLLNALFLVLKKELDKRIDVERKNNDAQIRQYENIIQEESLAIETREKEISALQQKILSAPRDHPPGRPQIAEMENALRQLNTEIGILRIFREMSKKDLQQLNATLGQSDYTQFIKEPTSSLRPVAPQKTLSILIAGILGLVMFTLFAFILEYLEKLKKAA